MDLDQYTAEVTRLLGKEVIVTTECGTGVFDKETFQSLFSSAKTFDKLTPEWVAKRIEWKNDDAARIKAAREKSILLIHGYLTGKGLTRNDVSVYPTTFGFSVDNLFQNGLDNAKKICSELGIEYKRMEYSDAHWVVRVIL